MQSSIRQISTFVWLASFFLSSGCSKAKKDSETLTSNKKSAASIKFDISDQLRLADLPIPLNLHLVSYTPGKITCLRYEGKTSHLDKIKNSIVHEAERNGWMLEKFDTEEITFFTLKKPSTHAIISLESPSLQNVSVRIVLKQSGLL